MAVDNTASGTGRWLLKAKGRAARYFFLVFISQSPCRAAPASPLRAANLPFSLGRALVGLSRIGITIVFRTHCSRGNHVSVSLWSLAVRLSKYTSIVVTL